MEKLELCQSWRCVKVGVVSKLEMCQSWSCVKVGVVLSIVYTSKYYLKDNKTSSGLYSFDLDCIVYRSKQYSPEDVLLSFK